MNVNILQDTDIKYDLDKTRNLAIFSHSFELSNGQKITTTLTYHSKDIKDVEAFKITLLPEIQKTVQVAISYGLGEKADHMIFEAGRLMRFKEKRPVEFKNEGETSTDYKTYSDLNTLLTFKKQKLEKSSHLNKKTRLHLMEKIDSVLKNKMTDHSKMHATRKLVNERASLDSKTKPSGPAIDKAIYPKVIQICDKVHRYTSDLSLNQKSTLETKIDTNTLKIRFNKIPHLQVTIRCQDIFKSGAQVIVNAANQHLGGGGGIDGEIHKRGGNSYREAHRELQSLYHSKYVSGHAAMIKSGLLEKENIDSVIVVAGPQGEATSKKEDELYSCYYNSLVLAEAQGKTSIAFPTISTGIFRFPKDRAAAISLKAVYDFMEHHPKTALNNISIHFLAKDPKVDLGIYEAAAG